MGFKGWIENFAGPQSLEDARPVPPEAELHRFDQAIAAVLGWRPKTGPRFDRAAAGNGPGGVPEASDKKKATRTVASQKGQRGRQDGAQGP